MICDRERSGARLVRLQNGWKGWLNPAYYMQQCGSTKEATYCRKVPVKVDVRLKISESFVGYAHFQTRLNMLWPSSRKLKLEDYASQRH